MTQAQPVWSGRGTEMFAGIPVRDLQTSLAWYQRLFGCPPTFYPNEKEAVWTVGEKRWVYIIVAPERAGGTIQTIMCEGLEEIIAEIAGRGLHFSKEETPDKGVRKVMYYDPDGNEIGVGRIPAG